MMLENYNEQWEYETYYQVVCGVGFTFNPDKEIKKGNFSDVINVILEYLHSGMCNDDNEWGKVLRDLHREKGMLMHSYLLRKVKQNTQESPLI